MELGPIVDGVAEDLRRAAALGGDDAARAAELLVAGMEASLRLHLFDALESAARELEESAPGVEVEVRLAGRDPVLALRAEGGGAAPGGARGPGVGDYADDELLRLTIRLPEGLKVRVEQAAVAAGASINSWIVSALVRVLEGPPPERMGPGRRMPRRVSGFVQG